MSGLIDTAFGWWRHGEPDVARSRIDPEAHTHRGDTAPETAKKPTPPAIIESPWLTTADRHGLPRTIVYPATSLGRLLDQTADRFGPSTALIYNHRTWTWSEVREQANRLAGGLARLGVRRGERVVTTLPNCPEFVITFFAVQKLGAVLVNAGPLMGADDLQSVFTMTAPRLVIGLDLQAPALCRAGRGSTVEHWVWVSLAFYQNVFKRIGYQFKLWHEREGKVSHPETHLTMEKLLEESPSRPPTVDPEPDRVAVLQPTGGTTGVLKLVQLSHRNFISNAAQICAWTNGRLGQERFLAVLPMCHVYGLTVDLMAATYLASPLILTTRFDPAETIEMVHRYEPTMFPLVPAIAEAVCDRLEKEPADERAELVKGFQKVRLCISGAAPLPAAIADRFTRITGACIVEGYGLSEASPVTHVNPPSAPRIGSIGLPLPDTRVRVVDLQTGTQDVPPGEPGEMLVSGPQVMSGYFSNADQTKAALSTDTDGRLWLHTGDVVRIDTDGYFHVQDRKKDMIIRSGLKVYPAKVERLLKSHDRVADVAVIGRPDPVHTEQVVAYIVLKSPPENRQLLAEELRTFCRRHLAPYEVPAKVEFLNQLPRTALGKLLKNQLRAMAPLGSHEGNGNGNGHAHNGNGEGEGDDPSSPKPASPNGKGHKKEAA